MLKSWSVFSKEIPPTGNVQNPTKFFWNNKDILIAGKSVFYPEFVNAGVLYLNDGQKVHWEFIHSRGVPNVSPQYSAWA